MAQTSLNSTGVASTGALSLQSNGTTEAIGISTGQVATFAQNPILTSGTANGVTYLNASKVMTSGSALTFDGTNFATTGRVASNRGADGVFLFADGAQYIYGTSGSTGYISMYQNGSEQMRLTSTGLGIGTSSPGAKLHVTSGAVGVQALFSYSSGTPTIAVGNSTTNYNLQLGYNVTSEYGYIQATAAVGVADDIVINPNGGNLGLGNTSPQARFHTKAGAVTQGAIVETGGANSFLSFADAGTSSYTRVQIGSAGNNFVTYINGSEAARIDSSGNLLVGQTSSGGYANSNSMIYFPGSTGAQYMSHASGSASGNVYVGFGYNASQIGSITQNGTTGVLYNITSDYRLKDVIGAVSGSGERIDALQPVDYTMKADGSAHRGFLAHQFQAVYANSVTGTKDAMDEQGNPVYQQMQPGTAEVIADLVAEIQSLRKRLAALEAK